MKNYAQAVSQFNAAFEVKEYEQLVNVPERVFKLRAALIEEELKEYEKALEEKNRLEQLDGLVDIIYVVTGAAVICGIAVPPKHYDGSLAQQHEVGDCDWVVEELRSETPCIKRLTPYVAWALYGLEHTGAREGFKIPEAFNAVHKNNMAKLWDEKPKDPELVYALRPYNKWLVKNKAGKVIKPPGHTKVDLRAFI